MLTPPIPSIQVYVCETRPFLQGARLTAYELLRESIPVTLIADNAAGALLHQKKVHVVLVGADCIAANGDVANKIGTYTLAALAHLHQVPFYVAAPRSTIDAHLADGHAIPIEERDSRELTHFRGHPVAPEGISVWNPAFDITPHHYLTGIVTELGILTKPYKVAIQKALKVRTIVPGFGASRHIWRKKLQSNLGSMRFYEYVPLPNRKNV